MFIAFVTLVTTFSILTLDEAGFELEYDSDIWQPIEKVSSSGRTVYGLVRTSDTRDGSLSVFPMVTIIIEDVSEDMDLELYSALVGTQKYRTVKRAISNEEDFMTFENSTGHLVEYLDKRKVYRTAYVIYAINKSKALTLIMETNSKEFDEIRPELESMIRSLKLKQ